MYNCKICNKEIKLLKNHLKNTHKMLECDYFAIFGELEKRGYEEFRLSLKQEFRECSPNSIHFYLKRGYTEEEANVILKNKRAKHIFNIGKEFRPNQIKYWVKKGYTEEDAVVKVKLNNSNSLESCIIKYGKKDGVDRYNKFVKSLESRKVSEINNLVKVGYTKEEATIHFSKKRRDASPWLPTYWLNLGYTQEEAKLAISEFQDNWSLSSIMRRKCCNIDTAVKIQDTYILRMKATLVKNGHIIPDNQREEFCLYRLNCWRHTNKTYRLYEHIINPKDIDRARVDLVADAHHLDHKYSIFAGFVNTVEAEVIGSVYNLEMLPAIDNVIKGAKCSITKEELMEKYNADTNKH